MAICVTSILMNQQSTPALVPGETFGLSATAYPSNATNKTLTWFSDNENIATVNASTGLVTARGVGTTTVTAMATDGSGVTADCRVTVKSGTVLVTSILLNQQSTPVLEPGDTFTLSATAYPTNATNRVLRWFSCDESIATVNPTTGQVTAQSGGTTIVTAMATDGSGVSADCPVTVKNSTIPVTSVSISPSFRALTPGESFYASATVCPRSASNKSVCWSSNNDSVATVNPDSGLVTAQGNGTATITAMATDGSRKRDTCRVTVSGTISVDSVELSDSSRTMTPDTFFTLRATVCPDNASNRSVCWTSSNPGVATVDSNGKVCALKAGTAVIRATAADDSGQSDCCTVTVKADTVLVTSVSVSPPCKQLSPGESFYATASVFPGNASNRSVCWTSSNPGVATVNPSSGLVIAQSTGTVTITATANDGSGKRDTCFITVSNLIPVSNLMMSNPSLTMNVGKTRNLTVSLYPANATNRTVTWSSSDPSVASLTSCNRSCTITSQKAGTAVITATANDGSGLSASCTVTVTSDTLLESIVVCPTRLTLEVGESDILTATVSPADAINKTVCWYSSNSSVVTVNPSSGMVYALKAGTALITARATDGSGEIDSCLVTVQSAAERVMIKNQVVDFISHPIVTFSNGQVWKCIGRDMMYIERPLDISQIYFERNIENCSQSFDTEKLAFLFNLDPHGVAYYVYDRARGMDTVTEGLLYKDEVYTAIYGQRPEHFVWDSTLKRALITFGINEDNRYNVYSMAELIFGMHRIYEPINVVLSLIEVAIGVIEIILLLTPLEPLAIAFTTIDSMMSFFLSGSVVGDIGADTVDLFGNAPAGGEGLSLMSSLFGIVDALGNMTDDPGTINAENLKHLNTRKDFNIIIELENGKTLTLSEFMDKNASWFN